MRFLRSLWSVGMTWSGTKKRKVHFAILPMVVIVRMSTEINGSVVLKNKNAVFFKKLILENQIHQKLIVLAVIRRVGENQVVFGLVHRQKPEDIRFYYR